MNYTDANKNPSGPPAGLYSQQKLLTDAATEKVATLIGDDFSCPDLFCQMDVLRPYLDDVAWKEIGRWVRYEEAVEEGGERWSKPHVASLMMEALLELQDLLASCPVFIDFPAKSITEIADAVVKAWMDDGNFPYMLRDHYKAILLKEHLFQHLSKKEMKKKHASSPNLARMQNESYINGSYESTEKYSLTVPTTSATMPKNMLPKVDPPTPHTHHKTHLNTAFLKKIPPGSEVVNLMVGEIEELEHSISAFIKLKDASNVGDITEVDLPTKFMFIILGPANSLGPSAEMCRCLATLFTDEVFRCVAHRAKDREDLLAGISEFSQHLTVLPPGAWDPSTRIEPPDEIPSQEHRKGGQTGTMSKNKSTVSLHSMDNSVEADEHEEESHCDPTLVRTGRLFGGLIADVKRKIPHYLSDFKDALHIQCVASFFFLFLATLTPNVTFGGLLGQATDQYMGAMECILSAAISGVIFALFAGQPLNILGSTGPMLVLENILYQFCKDQEWDFLPFRVWVGFWTALMIMLIVAFDLSALVRFITRFTEESFACLIALIFIYEAFKKTFEISKIAPVHIGPPSIDSSLGCCILQQGGNLSYTSMYVPPENATERDIFKGECEFGHGSFVNHSCPHGVDHYVPDVFFFSVILFLGTFVLSTALVNFRHSLFFPTFVRQNVSDFAVLISIIIMVVFDALVGLPTPKLQVPVEFKPSRPGRPWLINPISDKNPWWLMLLSAVPALLATILIFMDQQITAVIVNRRENKLKKGSGYHLDMLVVAILVVVLALLGLPWYVAATVTALAHIMSLRKVSECTAPGEKPVFLGVREQRVTALLVGIFSGMAVFLTSVLNYVPMAVLYGVFLFMGVAPLGNMQLIQRIMLVFMPTKYQPEYAYIRNVPIRRVHLFTAIQVVNLIGLWIVKSIKSISIAFPLMVLIICFVRKALDLVFTQRELKWLDDILPPIREKKETPVQVQPVFIKVTEFDDAESVATTIGSEKPPTVRKLSVPVYEREKETDIDKEVRETYDKVKQRQSLTFGCKTEIDQLKGQRPAYLTDRRQSLIMAVERKKSLQSDGLTASRRISGQSTDGVLSANQPLGHTHSHGHSSAAHVEEHNRINRILSLPATIEDEPEIEDKKK